jgi:hypothetical protein
MRTSSKRFALAMNWLGASLLSISAVTDYYMHYPWSSEHWDIWFESRPSHRCSSYQNHHSTSVIIQSMEFFRGLIPCTVPLTNCDAWKMVSVIERSWIIELDACSSASILVTGSVIPLSNNIGPRQKSSMFKEFYTVTNFYHWLIIVRRYSVQFSFIYVLN